MGIVDEDIARVRESVDLVDLVRQQVALRRVGRRWQGLCPFHAEKSPSFSVNGEQGLYHCFGCQASGDVITWVRETEHLDFAAAVEWLAARAGVTLRYTSKDEGQNRQRRDRLLEAVEAATAWYHDRLVTAPDAAPARAYLRSRGYDGDVVREYRLGWAPDEWDALAQALKRPVDEMTDAGLVFVNRRGRPQDVFRARVLFPIADVKGDPVAFGGRKLEGGDGPKYKNSPDNRLYQKSKVLYGLDRAKDAVVKADEAIVCEGYTDVIGFDQVGLGRAVATCGTALTDDHVRVLKRFAPRLVLAFDADAAGQAAAERIYEWERKFEVDVAVAALPPGSDPADLARSDPGALTAAVDQATPLLGFRVQRVLTAADLATPESRSRAAEAAVHVIAEHPSPLVRDQYVMDVAGACRVDPERLRALLDRPRSRGGDAARGGGGERTERTERVEQDDRSVRPEREALRLAVQRPADTLPVLDPVLFSSERHAMALAALRAHGDVHAAIASADPGAAALLAEVAVEDSDADPLDVARRLVVETAGRVLRDLAADASRADDPAPFLEAHRWLKLEREALLIDENADPERIEQLVRWLTERAGLVAADAGADAAAGGV